jgi:hypothetical protein
LPRGAAKQTNKPTKRNERAETNGRIAARRYVLKLKCPLKALYLRGNRISEDGAKVLVSTRCS